MLLDQEVAWLVLLIRKRNDLGELGLVWLLLVEVNGMTINDNVLSEVLVGVQAVGMWWRWLVHGPVVEWWVDNWVSSSGLNQVISIDTIDDEVSEIKILVSGVTVVVWWRWLVDGPVVEGWVPDWVCSVDLSIGLNKVQNLSVVANFQVYSKSDTCHRVLSHDRFWVNCNWYTIHLKGNYILDRTLQLT